MQLKLNRTQLEKLGFKKKIYPEKKEIPGIMPATSEKITHEIPFPNGCFYYNWNETTYRWYQRINVGENSHHIHLDIESLPGLITLLQCFRTECFRTYTILDIEKEKECPDCRSPLEDNGACSDVGSNCCQYQA